MGLIAAVDQQTIGTNAIVAMAQNSNMLVAQLVGNGAMAYLVAIGFIAAPGTSIGTMNKARTYLGEQV